MNLKELLQVINQVALDNGVRAPYLVGGIPRDIAMGVLDSLNDIDLTNGDGSISQLADLISVKLGVPVDTLSDGHKKLRYDRFSIDFSTNQKYANIDQILLGRGVKTVNDMVREVFSRDFTINTLMVPLDFSKVIDITAMGKYDIDRRVIRCPVDPVIALQASPNRIIRAFLYAAKYKMKIDDSLISAIKSNLDLLSKVKEKYASDKISAALKYDLDILDVLIETGVLQRIKMTKDITDQLIRARRLGDVL